MPSTLEISYNLKPPSQESPIPAHLSPIAKHEFPVCAVDKAAHYAALREAIAKAREVTGRELTEWRDAVGAVEKGNTGIRRTEELDDEDEGEGEGEE